MKQRGNLKRLLAAANRLSMDMSFSEGPMEGYVRAMDGYVDSNAQRKALVAFDRLVAEFPDDEYCRYLRAGFLMRCAEYDQAEEIYAKIASGSGHYKLPAHLMLVIVHWHAHGKERAQLALNLHNKLARELNQPVNHVDVSDMFAV